jgi:hypothetical protein
MRYDTDGYQLKKSRTILRCYAALDETDLFRVHVCRAAAQSGAGFANLVSLSMRVGCLYLMRQTASHSRAATVRCNVSSARRQRCVTNLSCCTLGARLPTLRRDRKVMDLPWTFGPVFWTFGPVFWTFGPISWTLGHISEPSPVGPVPR